MNPLVCICIPTYNAAKTIQETLESILSQTYSNLIVHISDNASTDDTLKILESFDDRRLHIHPHSENVGGEGNFTRCLQMAEGEYTAIYHADDVYAPSIIEKQVNFLENHSDIGSVFTKAFTINEQGKRTGVIGRVPEGKANVSMDFETLLKIMLCHHNFLVCPSVLVRTTIYKHEIKSWGSDMFKSASDVAMWLHLSQILPVVVLDETLMSYRISSQQFSDRIRKRTKPTDFFLVMEHYLAKKDIQDFLGDKELQRYGWLKRHDAVVCAWNLWKLGRGKEAKPYLEGLFCWDAIHAALCTKRGMKTLAAGAYMYIRSGRSLNGS